MKIEQEKVFAPITITLETTEEAVLFFTLIRSATPSYETDALKGSLMSWFREEFSL